MKNVSKLSHLLAAAIMMVLALWTHCAVARPVGLSAEWTGVEGAEESATSLTASGTFIALNAFPQGPVILNSGESIRASLNVSIGATVPKFDDDGLFVGFGNAAAGGYLVAEFDTSTPQATPFRHRSRNTSTNLAGTVDLAPWPTDDQSADPGAANHFDGNNTVSLRVSITRTDDGFVFETDWGGTLYTSTVTQDEWAPGENALDTFFFRSRQPADWEVTNLAVDFESTQGLDPDLVVESIPLPGNLGLNPESLTFAAPIRNGGSTKILMIESVAIEGDGMDHFTVGVFPESLEPGASGSIALTFDDQGATGVFEAMLVITTNTQDSPVSVPLSTRVPLITTFRATPSVINVGETATLSWVTDPRAELTIDPNVGNLSGVTVDGAGSLTVMPGEDTEYVLSASLGDDLQDRKVPITTLQIVPRGPVALMEDWSFDDGDGEGTDSTLNASGTFRARQPFEVGQIALAVRDFVSVRLLVAHGDAKPDFDDDGVFIGFGNGEAGGYILSEMDTGLVGETPVRHRYRNGSTNLMSTVDLVVAADISNGDVDPGEANHLNGDNTVEINVILGCTEQGYQLETDWAGTSYTSVIPEATWSPGNHSIDTFFFRARAAADWELSQIAVAFNLAGQDPDLVTPENLVADLRPGAGPYTITIPITNAGELNTLSVTGAQIIGPDRNLFVLGELPTSIAPQATETITLEFSPGGRQGGFAAILEIESNDPGDSVSQLDLSTFLGNADALLAHYPFDEDDAKVLFDHSGNGRHGQFQAENGAMILTSQLGLATGSAVAFVPGEEDAAFAEIPKTAGLPALQDFSVSLWFQADPSATGVSVLFSKGDALGDPFSLALTGNALLWVASTEQSEPFAEVVTGEPQHLVISVSEQDVTLYLDGALRGSVVSEMFDDSRPSAFRVASLNGLFGFHGTFDDLQIYNKTLIAEEVLFLQENPGSVLTSENGPEISTGLDIVVSLQRTADGVAIAWPRVDGQTYEVEHSETMETGSWQVFGAVDADNVPFVDMAEERIAKPAGYYRVIVRQ